MNGFAQAIESSTVKKTMVRILPFVFICYVIAFLDRVNLGYAALEMNADLSLSAEAFGLLSGIFFIGYFLFEVPSNMMMHKVGARIWIARIMITWGIITLQRLLYNLLPTCTSPGFYLAFLKQVSFLG